MRTKRKTVEFSVELVNKFYGTSFGKIGKILGLMKVEIEATTRIPLGKDRGES